MECIGFLCFLYHFYFFFFVFDTYDNKLRSFLLLNVNYEKLLISVRNLKSISRHRHNRVKSVNLHVIIFFDFVIQNENSLI